MEHITTFMGEDFMPLAPNVTQIHIEDIAHALSLMCRANGHIVRFFSVAQHSINCANEAKARNFPTKIQLACLLHDASEAYLSDITRPVKAHLPQYMEVEKRLQDMIYSEFLGGLLSEEEYDHVRQIDDIMLKYEFDALMGKKVFDHLPPTSSKPAFELASFIDIENEFICIYAELANKPASKKKELTEIIANIENRLKDKTDVVDYLKEQNIRALFAERLFVKGLSAQIDTYIHAYGILLALPKILDPDEQIVELSLGAGTGGKPFDLVTTKRIAEFKFARWSDHGNAIRQNNIFKDYVQLVLEKSNKIKCIYCYDADKVKHFLETSGRNLESVFSKNSIHKKYPDIQHEYLTVRDFYADYQAEVEIVELENLLGQGE